MSNTQIWVAIFLGFILVAMAINAVKWRGHPGLDGRSPKEREAHEQELKDELSRIRTGVDELGTKVDSIERMLLEVQ